MKKLLVIHSSPMGEASKTRELAELFVKTWQQTHPGGQVIRRDVGSNPPPHINAQTIGAYYTAADDRSEEQRAAIALSDELVDELEAADEVVIASPMHNFSITSGLKTWVDHVARVGRTFQYTENGPQGLLKGKKAHVIVARGGSYGAGSPAAAMNHQDSLLRTVLGFIGISDVEFIAAEGVAAGDAGMLSARDVIEQKAA
jgi:FMN-dependent NADH-azoreductase